MSAPLTLLERQLNNPTDTSRTIPESLIIDNHPTEACILIGTTIFGRRLFVLFAFKVHFKVYLMLIGKFILFQFSIYLCPLFKESKDLLRGRFYLPHFFHHPFGNGFFHCPLLCFNSKIQRIFRIITFVDKNRESFVILESREMDISLFVFVCLKKLLCFGDFQNTCSLCCRCANPGVTHHHHEDSAKKNEKLLFHDKTLLV